MRHEERPVSRLLLYECLEEVVGFRDVFQKAGGVAEFCEGGARQQFVGESGHYALGRLTVRFVIVSDVFGEFHWPLVYGSCANILLTKSFRLRIYYHLVKSKYSIQLVVKIRGLAKL